MPNGSCGTAASLVRDRGPNACPVPPKANDETHRTVQSRKPRKAYPSTIDGNAFRLRLAGDYIAPVSRRAARVSPDAPLVANVIARKRHIVPVQIIAKVIRAR